MQQTENYIPYALVATLVITRESLFFSRTEVSKHAIFLADQLISSFSFQTVPQKTDKTLPKVKSDRLFLFLFAIKELHV